MTRPPDIIYLHGFRSSPDSEKASTLSDWLAQQGYQGTLHMPMLATDPLAVEQQLVSLITGLLEQGRQVVLIGSSLGGFFAALVAGRLGLRGVLINPAAYPYELLEDYTGEHENLYTGERFTVTEAHLQALRQMDQPMPHPESLLLLLQTGDEVLDYRQALERFKGATVDLEQGGEHSFTGFAQKLPAILDFLTQSDR
ncbi:MAG: alpha/beta fold hydrolase [Halomonadaceae bacterium]|nr:MAG: alpha/beta fold hydrolase [Halomonadaceae bacterium]